MHAGTQLQLAVVFLVISAVGPCYLLLVAEGEEDSTLSMSLARSMAMTEAAQPMPDRLNVRTVLGSLKWFTTAADRLGVGAYPQQLTITPPICSAASARGGVKLRSKSSASASRRAAAGACASGQTPQGCRNHHTGRVKAPPVLSIMR